ncbi:unnamed protein product [Clonostachys rosea]|uniref:Uncharacterized protein n=1 Tax=Bionectria ochroleuca TaxID=29856 RepID=A0ABY6TVM0_BIOOC|nr:unnamed protein product [Clonostachys rosea]
MEGWDKLITALYLRGTVDEKIVKKCPRTKKGMKLLKYDFILMSGAETSVMRDQKSKEALAMMGMQANIVNGVPVHDVD